MKKNTHPTYHPAAKIECACGAKYEVGSTLEEVRVEVCASCHPFYTGKQKLVDTARRVEKFEAKAVKTIETAKTRKGKTAKKAALKTKRSSKVAVRKIVKKIGSGRRKAANSASVKDKLKKTVKAEQTETKSPQPKPKEEKKNSK